MTFDIAADETLECTFTNTKNKATQVRRQPRSLIPQDKATVSGFDATGSKDGKLHFSLWDNAACSTDNGGTLLYSEDKTVTANGD